MVTVGMNYQIREGKTEIFEQVFDKVIEIMNNLDGHQETHLYTKVKDGNSYLILSAWSSREAFDAFIASEQFRNVANWGKEEILAGRPSHEYYGDPGEPSPGSAPRCPVGKH